jgi:hypothetical protein
VSLTFSPKKTQRETGCLPGRHKTCSLFYHLVKKKEIHIRRQNPFERRAKKTLDKFEIIRKLETIRNQ